MKALLQRGRSEIGFIAVGLINNLIGYLLFVGLVWLGLSPAISLTISYPIGMLISYSGNRIVSFGHVTVAKSSIPKFLLVNALGYALNQAILFVFVSVLGFPPAIVQLGGIACVAVITFLLMKHWVFRPAPSSHAGEDPQG